MCLYSYIFHPFKNILTEFLGYIFLELYESGKLSWDNVYYQHSNALVTCFEHVDIKWYHFLITLLEFEQQSPVMLVLTSELEKQK